MSGQRRRDAATLRAACHDRGYTPAAADTNALVALWTDAPDDAPEREAIARALGRGDAGVARHLLSGLSQAPPRERALRLKAVATIARRVAVDGWTEALSAALADPDARVLREAARAVGQAQTDDSLHEAALLGRIDTASLPERRAIVDALGRIGGPATAQRLRALTSSDAELTRRVGKALTLLQRRAERSTVGTIRTDVALGAIVPLRLRCRAGAAPVVAAEVRAVFGDEAADARIEGPGAVALPWRDTLARLHAIRTAVDAALVFVLADGDALAVRIVTTLRRPDVQTAMQAWSEGPPTFRLRFVGQGHRRAVAWKVAEALSRDASALRNDSRNAAWTVEVDEARASLRCIPRHGDDRFAYRLADVPAASHPTLAATLAWHGAPQAGERVWDPFCGSGSELIECATRADGLHLVGSDVDPAAIDAATRNFAAAGRQVASAHFRVADARSADPGGPVSLVVSNPPMGRRVARDGKVRELLAEAIAAVSLRLAPNGRWVWVTASPRWTAEVARDVGLVVETLHDFDMGGFSVAVHRMRRRP